MIDPSQLEPLRDRRRHIEKRRAELAVRAAKLARQLDELSAEGEAIDTTLDTLARVYGVQLNEEAEIKGGRSTGGSSTKPENTPTLFEMIETILNDWTLLDDLHEGQAIYDEVRRRWWPDAPRNSVIPSLWRFANEERLVKDGTRYGLIQKNEAPGASTPSASETDWDIDDEPI